uniref:Uncharacterized protein n=1 Tax=Zea mays TaxID=4577 RepID=B7ZZA9_MAIZE|nr:unknown [Zea mays]
MGAEQGRFLMTEKCDDEEDGAHGVDGGGEASRGSVVVRAGHGESSPDGLQLARGRPGPGHAPGEGPEVGAGAGAGAPAAAAPAVVARGLLVGAAEGSVALADDAPAVPVVEHEDGEVGERLAGAADLGLPERRGGIRGRGEDGCGDGEVLAPLADEVEAVADGVAEVERLDGAVGEVGDEAVERGPRGGRVPGAEEQGAELLEAEEEGFEEAARPGEGEDVVGCREVGQELGGAALEGVCGVWRRREGVDLVLVTAERADGAADGGQRRRRRRRRGGGVGGRHCASHRSMRVGGLGTGASVGLGDWVMIALIGRRRRCESKSTEEEEGADAETATADETRRDERTRHGTPLPLCKCALGCLVTEERGLWDTGDG